ncbi:hypothetical protein [Streptomyces sp. NA04227]|uniref:hypothetical protein n=1 Tax=Streptomyces sp. NA04227 TaxID=2742136 RepID=UPI0020CA8318|nr:hypothetical protein [Streptomyces sp. NA04227]
MYRYRCTQCRTTSLPVHTRSALAQERHSHRVLKHGGHIPDGEQIIEPKRFNFFDLPREQQIAGSLMIAAILVAFLFRVL